MVKGLSIKMSDLRIVACDPHVRNGGQKVSLILGEHGYLRVALIEIPADAKRFIF